MFSAYFTLVPNPRVKVNDQAKKPPLGGFFIHTIVLISTMSWKATEHCWN